MKIGCTSFDGEQRNFQVDFFQLLIKLAVAMVTWLTFTPSARKSHWCSLLYMLHAFHSPIPHYKNPPYCAKIWHQSATFLSKICTPTLSKMMTIVVSFLLLLSVAMTTVPEDRGWFFICIHFYYCEHCILHRLKNTYLCMSRKVESCVKLSNHDFLLSTKSDFNQLNVRLVFYQDEIVIYVVLLSKSCIFIS